MFQGLCFIVDGKMCVCVGNNEIMVWLDPEKYLDLVEQDGCRQMIHRGKVMKGFVFVKDAQITTPKKLTEWVNHALNYNERAKVTPKRKKNSLRIKSLTHKCLIGPLLR